MELKLYFTNDGENVINKTLLGEQILQINLKRETDVTAPILIIRGDSLINPEVFNYCELPNLNRKYFIRTIENVGYNLWRLICETDVVETYKADILASKARYNRNIRNGDYMQGAIDFSTIKSVEKFFSPIDIVGQNSIILTSVGEV